MPEKQEPDQLKAEEELLEKEPWRKLRVIAAKRIPNPDNPDRPFASSADLLVMKEQLKRLPDDFEARYIPGHPKQHLHSKERERRLRQEKRREEKAQLELEKERERILDWKNQNETRKENQANAELHILQWRGTDGEAEISVETPRSEVCLSALPGDGEGTSRNN